MVGIVYVEGSRLRRACSPSQRRQRRTRERRCAGHSMPVGFRVVFNGVAQDPRVARREAAHQPKRPRDGRFGKQWGWRNEPGMAPVRRL